MTSPTRQNPSGTRPASAPSSVRTATLVLYGMLAVLVVRAILSIVAQDALLDAFAESRGRDRSGEFDRAVIEQSAPAYTTIAIGSLVLFGTLLALSAFFLARGARWARIVAIVVAVLNVLGLLVVIAQPAPIWYRLLGLVAGLLAVALLVLLFRPDARAFFRRTA